MRALLLLVVLVVTVTPGGPSAETEFRVLVFSKTLGYRHPSIPNGIALIQTLGAEDGFAVDTTEDAAAFNAGWSPVWLPAPWVLMVAMPTRREDAKQLDIPMRRYAGMVRRPNLDEPMTRKILFRRSRALELSGWGFHQLQDQDCRIG